MISYVTCMIHVMCINVILEDVCIPEEISVIGW